MIFCRALDAEGRNIDQYKSCSLQLKVERYILCLCSSSTAACCFLAQDSFDRDIQSVVTTLKGVGDKYEKGMSEATSETRRRIISEAFDLSGGVEYETFHASALIVKRVVEKTTGADVDAVRAGIFYWIVVITNITSPFLLFY